MSSITIQPPVDELAFEQIEAAVMETSRGRWFLDEYAKRHRHADTMAVLDAIASLQRNLAQRPVIASLTAPSAMNDDILEMARAIARTERDIRALRKHDGNTHHISASDELDAVVSTTEQATSTILSAAERVQEQAWTMRERGGDEAECDQLDHCATEIYTACGFQDLTAQRIRKVIGTVRFLDTRIKAMLTAAGLEAEIESGLEQETSTEQGLRAADIWMSEAHQAEIDDTFEFFTPAAQVEPTMVGAELMDLDDEILEPTQPVANSIEASAKVEMPAPAAPVATAAAALASYDALPTEERLRLFR